MADREYYFASDLMHFITKTYKLHWSPPVERNSSSLLTPLLEKNAKKYLSFVEATILSEYLSDLQECISDKLEFRHFAVKCFADADVELGKEGDIFHLCVYLARVASHFLECGMQDAPDAAVHAIKDILLLYHETYHDDIFEKFREFDIDAWIESTSEA